jgi:hypothetical protein
LIVGVGLFVFALSTFQPTQRFGVLMLVLLNTATLGDLFVLPALLAGPLGKYVGKEKPRPANAGSAVDGILMDEPDSEVRVISHPILKKTEATSSDSTNGEDANRERKRQR